jgi:hypothetical protein
MRFLKKGQKEVIIRCGKDFRYVVDYDTQTVKALGRGAKDAPAAVNS